MYIRWRLHPLPCACVHPLALILMCLACSLLFALTWFSNWRVDTRVTVLALSEPPTYAGHFPNVVRMSWSMDHGLWIHGEVNASNSGNRRPRMAARLAVQPIDTSRMCLMCTVRNHRKASIGTPAQGVAMRRICMPIRDQKGFA